MTPLNDPYLTLPLEGLRLIEASAGTGKTFTLATLFTRLVVEQHLRMGQILAVTFTDAATQELRGRIRERLELAARLAADPSRASTDDNQETILTRAILSRHLDAHPHTRAQVQARLRLAAEETDLAAIFTIHGFCARVLREHALESGNGVLNAELVPHPGDLYAQLAADLWRQHSACAASMESLSALWKKPDALAADLPALAGDLPLHPELPMHLLPDPRADVESAAKTLQAAIEQHLESARDAIARAFDHKIFNGRKTRRASFDKAFAELLAGCPAQHWPRGDQSHFEKLSAKRLADFCNEGKPAPISSLFIAVQAWCEADDTQRRWLNQEKIRCLQQLRGEARQCLAALKQQQQVYTYDDLISNLANALQGTNGEVLAARIREHYRFALVDEFQDTDARQWQIFQCLFAVPDHPGGLFLIGDPKQAIYGFRGGDVATYLHAKTQAERAPPLNRNFRSRPALLRAIAHLYTHAGEAAFAGAEIQFEPVLPGGRREDSDYLRDQHPAPALTICTLETKQDAVLAAEPAREAATRACVAHLHQVLTLAFEQRAMIDGRPISPGDIAVLVRRHSDAARIQQALSAVGIAAVAAGRRSLFASEEAVDIRRLLLSLVHPLDEGRLRTALSGVLLGLGARAIATLDADPAQQQHWQQRALAWRERWQRVGIFALIAGICADQAQRLLGLGDGERRLTNYLQLAEHLQQASADSIGPHALLDWLNTRMLHADDQNETEQLRLESDARCVQILTLHKSKGLEYPLVYLPFIGIDTRAGQSARHLDIYQQGQRVLYWNIDPDSDGWKSACRDAEHAQRAEAARLLYVGLTRARHAVWLAAGALPGLESSPLGALLKDVLNKSGGKHSLRVGMGCKAQTGALADASARICNTADRPNPQMNATPRLVQSFLKDPAALAGADIEVQSFAVEHTARLPRLLPEHTSAPPPARLPQRRIAADWWVYSFTQLARMQTGQELPTVVLADEEAPAAEDEVEPQVFEQGRGDAPSPFTGPRFGNTVHAALESASFAAWANWQPDLPAPPSQTDILRKALERAGWHGEAHGAGVSLLTTLVGHTLTAALPEGGRLADLPAEHFCAEMEFHFEIKPTSIRRLLHLLHRHRIATTRSGFGLRQRLEGLMTGKIDLTYVGRDGRWYLLDYKSNQLPSYAPAALDEAMAQHQYDLQALIYTLALHRWLGFRLQDGYDYNRDVGGIRYLFCRGLDQAGAGIFSHRFAPELVFALDALLAGRDESMNDQHRV